MSLYAVGDLHGCVEPLKRLLDHVKFDPSNDQLWLTGDLVCRGPDSIGTLEYVRSLGDAAQTVLGNHDLHLLACYEALPAKASSEIRNILKQPNAAELLAWLIEQPMLVQDEQRKLIMTHAGIPPQWSDKKAIKRAREAESCFADKNARYEFFKQMYGQSPNRWSGKLIGHNRLRYIVNAFTRMRFCDANGKLDFKAKSSPQKAPLGMLPWYEWPANKREHRLIFGHWAALMGITHNYNMIGLDTGYAWGNYLTLMNMDNSTRYICDAKGDIAQLSQSAFDELSTH
ncbi:symmetrical bis(5'-nucleosyl)-tetraphosphatase [Reinekea thalattae]|uniref:bis(5'-nucleosyl)-tetraphosphatase (symmetrical) n=1 Tax=Reinekea thalattae TaxID=2593301 RepID=A0A5C8Z4G8_9GAMM|nr:symmetrical bis(5'-nucleosyl)-tetraphosphatase [Reinekea thalattae]TXR51830.1 symmetrical bis(5'-nucleosyl)-tetraphosphatase [Reinekea thalattae]